MAKWLSVREASDLTGLKPKTLAGYARSFQSDLVPNRDFRVRTYRQGVYQRKQLLFSQRGIARLVSGSYRVFQWKHRPFPAHKKPSKWQPGGSDYRELPDPSWIVFPEHATPTDRARIARDYVTRCVQYLLEHPCAKDGCGCVCHAMLPGLNAMMELYNHDLQNKSTVIGREHGAPREETGLLTGRTVGPGYVPRYK